MICNSCHNKVEDGIGFCPYCGGNLALSNPGEKVKNEDSPVVLINNSDQIAQFDILEQPTLSDFEEKYRRKNALFICFLLISIILFFTCVGIIMTNQVQMQEYQTQAEGFSATISNIQAQSDAYEAQSESYANMLNSIFENGVYVKVTSVSNTDQNGNLIDTDLYASTLKFLSFQYDIYCKNTSLDELEVSIYDPEGELMQGDGSPDSATFAKSILATDNQSAWVIISGNQSGWGKESGSSYHRGVYLIQFKYHGTVVGEKAVVIR